MKKVFSFLVFLFTLFVANAQEGAHVGIMVNLNTVWIANQNAYGAEEYDYVLTFGGGGGVSGGYNFTDNLGVQADVLFSSQGQKYKESEGGLGKREVQLNYLLIPIRFQFNTSGDDAKFYVNLGPNLGILQKAELQGDGFTGSGSGTLEASERFNSTDFGIRIGLGGNIMITDMLYVSAGMDFMIGITDINDSEWQFNTPQNPYGPSRNVTAGLAIGVHYLFGQ